MFTPKSSQVQTSNPQKSEPTLQNTEEDKGSDLNKDNQNKQTEGYLPDNKLDENTIIVDGPLSRVYTDLLNQAFAKESYVTKLPHLVEMVKRQKEESKEKPIRSYIYTMSGNNLEGTDYTQAFESFQVALDNYKEVSLCIENIGENSDRALQLTNWARQNGMNVFYSREQAIETMAKKLKKL